MGEIFLKTLEMSVRAFWVILAVIALRALLKGAPKKYAYCLWAVVGFRLCCPVSFGSAFSLFSLGKLASPSAAPSSYAPPAAAGKAIGQAVGQFAQAGGIQGMEAPTAVASPFQGWIHAGATLWCLGALLLVGYGLMSYLKLSRRLGSAVRLEPGVYQSEYAGTAFVMGFAQPRIYVPFGLCQASLGYVLAHERYHIRRLDHFVKPIAYLLLAAHWFNPLCWVAFFLMARDMEMSCDEGVLAGEANAQSTYSAALLAVALHRRSTLSAPPAFGECGVKARIRNVLQWKKPSRWMTAAAAALCAAAMIFLAANPVEGAEIPTNAAYRVVSVEYNAPQYSFIYTPETAPGYWVGSDGSLWTCGGGQEGWTRLGQMEEVPLSAGRFDKAFQMEEDFGGAAGLAQALRQENRRAWRLSTGGVRYDLLQQKDGGLYLAYGYEDEGSGRGGTIRWLFRMERTQATISYRDSRTIYLSPLSSFWPDGNQYQYSLSPDSFVIRERVSGRESFRCAGLTWAWQPLAEGELPWETGFMPENSALDITGYERCECLTLSSEYSLLRLDGELWLIQFKENPQMGRYVWSVYALAREAAA